MEAKKVCSVLLCMYRVFRYLRPPPPQPIWALVHMKTVCFQDPISIPDYHASFQNYSAIYLLPVLWFMCQVEHIFMNNFWLYFWGGFPKMAIKSSIIGLDSYTIPHFNANMSWHASVSRQPVFHKLVLCKYCLNGSKVTI